MSHNYKSPYADNAAPIEKAIGNAHRAQLFKQGSPYPALLQPLNTPSQFLSAFAQERGVIDWYDSDSEAVKRATVNDSLKFLKKSGTRAAISEALGALNITAEFIKADRPYTLFVDGFLQDEAIDMETIARVERRINNYKSERDTIELSLIRADSAPVFVGVQLQVCDVVSYGAA